MRFEAYYETLENAIIRNSLSEIQKEIEKLGGFNRDDVRSDFKEHETAYIMEYNLLGRRTAQYYFSIKDKKWHRVPTKITDFSSWRYAKKPIKNIAEWILIKTKIKNKRDESVKNMTDFIHKDNSDSN